MIRRAKLNDYKELQKLSLELGYQCDDRSLYKNLEELLVLKDHIILVKEIENSTIAGYVHGQIYKLLYCDTFVNILGLVVSEKYRGSGHGKALMSEIEKWAESKGCKGIRLNSDSNRKEAHKFYEAIGFTTRKESKTFIKQF